SDPDGDALQISAVGTPANGTAQVSGNGVLYTPAAGFTGTDRFTYTISDSVGATASATVTVTVNAIEPPALPTAVITGLLPLYPDTDGQPGETVTASGASSTAIEGEIATYVWSVNGTEVLRGPDAEVSLALADGESTVELVVIDQGGLESEAASQTVAVAAISSNENLTPNQRETAAALEDTCSSLVGSDSLTPEQQQLLETCRAIIVDAETSQEVESALDALSGEQVTAAQTSGIDFSSMQLTNIGSRIKALRSGARGVSIAGLNIIHEGQRLPLEQLGGFVKALLEPEDGEGGGASGDDKAGGLFDDRLGLFMNGNVMFGEKDDTALEAGYDFDSIGITVGADYRFTDNVVAGFAVGYGDSSSDFTQNRGKLDSDGYSGSLFASYYDQGGYIDGILSYGRSSFDSLRRIAFTIGGNETVAEAKGDTDASTFGAGLSAGWDFGKGGFTFGPNVALSYIEVDVDGYTETGAGGYDLIYDDQTGKSFTIRAGGHASYAISGRWGVLTPQVRFDFVRELENDSQLVSARFAADPNSSGFVLATDVPDEEYFVWGLGLAGVFANGLSAFIDYQTVSSLDLIESHDFTIGIRYQRAFR
ncbi:MAG TPA: autotransporter domain-containing protein, partial [Steroidobacteraceae bacterium]|nr:autotransporter domain-containing protein [Steroidobacteraceae bacterium]